MMTLWVRVLGMKMMTSISIQVVSVDKSKSNEECPRECHVVSQAFNVDNLIKWVRVVLLNHSACH